METIKRYYRVDRSAIAYLKFIIEAYDGIATLRTLDPVMGTICLSIAPGCEGDVDLVLADLETEIMIEPFNIAPNELFEPEPGWR